MRRKVLTILLAYIPAGAVLAGILLVVPLRWVPVTRTPLMLVRYIQSAGECRPTAEWTPLADISSEMIRAVIAAEDQKFYGHGGFDFGELDAMRRERLREDAPLRGCSTISQQAAKNCFTFCSRTWLRKGVEAFFTVLIERLWGKERILEVYLNVAEMGPGVYGVEAAAQRYFGVHASELTMADASSLACCLPDPLHRDPDWVNRHMGNRRCRIAREAENKFMCN